LRGIGLRRSETSLTGRFPFDGCPTLIAESRSHGQPSSAGRADEADASPALQAELRARPVFVLAPGTLHHEVSGPPRLTLHRGGVKHGSPPSAPPATFHMPRSCLTVRTPRALRGPRRSELEPSPYQNKSHSEQREPCEPSGSSVCSYQLTDITGR